MLDIFNFLLNCSTLFVVCRTSCIREIQVVGIDTEEPCHPNRAVSALGATRSPRLADRRLHRSVYKETLRQGFLEVSRVSADQARTKRPIFDLAPEANCEPMKLVLNVGRDMRVLRYPQDDPRRCVRDGLETLELEPTGTVEGAVTVVDTVTDGAVRDHENGFLRERMANRTHCDIAAQIYPLTVYACTFLQDGAIFSQYQGHIIQTTLLDMPSRVSESHFTDDAFDCRN